MAEKRQGNGGVFGVGVVLLLAGVATIMDKPWNDGPSGNEPRAITDLELQGESSYGGWVVENTGTPVYVDPPATYEGGATTVDYTLFSLGETGILTCVSLESGVVGIAPDGAGFVGMVAVAGEAVEKLEEWAARGMVGECA